MPMFLIVCGLWVSKTSNNRDIACLQDQKVKALELAYTALARMAAANSNGDEAMKAAEEGLRAGVPARLRAFVPALLAYAVAGEVDKAFQVQ